MKKKILCTIAASILLTTSTFAIAHAAEFGQEKTADPVVVSIKPISQVVENDNSQVDVLTDETVQNEENNKPNLTDEDKEEIKNQFGSVGDDMLEKAFDILDDSSEAGLYEVLPDHNLRSPDGEIIITTKPKSKSEELSQWLVEMENKVIERAENLKEHYDEAELQGQDVLSATEDLFRTSLIVWCRLRIRAEGWIF